MENIKIILYSAIQGITEFLPVSSSAHLYLIQSIFQWNDNILILALGAHLGTLLAVLFHNRKLFYTLKINVTTISPIISSIPVIITGGIIGVFGLNHYSSNLLIIAFACISGGILLDLSDNRTGNKKDRNIVNIQDSILIGFFQVLALIPGMSRSGCVITIMRFLNINRLVCIKFSLLTGIPVLIAASSFGIYKVFYDENVNASKLIVIIIVSFFTAIISINFFLKWVKHFSFRIFSIYRIILGLLILLYFYS